MQFYWIVFVHFAIVFEQQLSRRLFTIWCTIGQRDTFNAQWKITLKRWKIALFVLVVASLSLCLCVRLCLCSSSLCFDFFCVRIFDKNLQKRQNFVEKIDKTHIFSHDFRLRFCWLVPFLISFSLDFYWMCSFASRTSSIVIIEQIYINRSV